MCSCLRAHCFSISYMNGYMKVPFAYPNFSKPISKEPPQFCDGSLLIYRIFYISLLTQDCFQILLYGRNWGNVIIFYQQVQYIRRDKCR